jgi:hypothetical protein
MERRGVGTLLLAVLLFISQPAGGAAPRGTPRNGAVTNSLEDRQGAFVRLLSTPSSLHGRVEKKGATPQKLWDPAQFNKTAFQV